jgi:hypothetical protein
MWLEPGISAVEGFNMRFREENEIQFYGKGGLPIPISKRL